MGGFRLWCGTNYNLDFDWQNYIDTTSAQFVAWGDETCPTTGRKHQQFWVYFRNQRDSKTKVAKELGKCHVEPCRGSLADNESYCSKEGSYHELGEKPAQGKRSDLEDLKDQILSGEKSVDDITCESPMMFHQYGRTLSRIEDIAFRKKFRTEMTSGLWLWGPTAVGKSHTAFEGYHPDTHYVWKDDNGWQDGYTGQEIVIINDFRGAIPYGDMLNLVDKWPYHVRRRGREPAPFISKKVIVTSSLPPEDVYHNLAARDSLEQLLRRFEVRHLTSNPGAPDLAQKCSEGNTGTSEPKSYDPNLDVPDWVRPQKINWPQKTVVVGRVS